MTMLWNCYFKGKYVGTTLNTQSEALGRDMPKLDAVTDMLPAYVRHMTLQVWHISGKPEEVSITLLRKGGQSYYPDRVTCVAYEF